LTRNNIDWNSFVVDAVVELIDNNELHSAVLSEILAKTSLSNDELGDLLVYAIKQAPHENYDYIDVMLHNGANVNIHNGRPLHLAIKYSHNVIRLLLDYGANIVRPGDVGIFVKNNISTINEATLKRLLELQGKLTAKDKKILDNIASPFAFSTLMLLSEYGWNVPVDILNDFLKKYPGLFNEERLLFAYEHGANLNLYKGPHQNYVNKLLNKKSKKISKQKNKREKTTTNSRQCTAITKAGKQCKKNRAVGSKCCAIHK
jgi:hypothetical protein